MVLNSFPLLQSTWLFGSKGEWVGGRRYIAYNGVIAFWFGRRCKLTEFITCRNLVGMLPIFHGSRFWNSNAVVRIWIINGQTFACYLHWNYLLTTTRSYKDFPTQCRVEGRRKRRKQFAVNRWLIYLSSHRKSARWLALFTPTSSRHTPTTTTVDPTMCRLEVEQWSIRFSSQNHQHPIACFPSSVLSLFS